MNNKFKNLFMLFVNILIQAGYSMPQGFFSQGLSIPKIVSWNSNEGSLAILPDIKVASPIKSSHLNVFGKKHSADEKSKKEQQPINDKFGLNKDEFKINQNLPIITNQDEKTEHSNIIQGVKRPSGLKQKEQLISKFSDLDDNAPDNVNEYNELTTESLAETTTDNYETTTFVDELVNRASPQLVASLLG